MFKCSRQIFMRCWQWMWIVGYCTVCELMSAGWSFRIVWAAMIIVLWAAMIIWYVCILDLCVVCSIVCAGVILVVILKCSDFFFFFCKRIILVMNKINSILPSVSCKNFIYIPHYNLNKADLMKEAMIYWYIIMTIYDHKHD